MALQFVNVLSFVLVFVAVPTRCRPPSETRAISGQCPSNFLKCASTGSCVPVRWQCDGENDCADGTDETNCGGTRPTFATTTTTPFVPVTDATTQRRTNFLTVPGVTASPGVTGPVSIQCGASYFYCTVDSACIPLEWLCDGDLDCDDGSDEQLKCSNQPPPDTSVMPGVPTNQIAMTASNGMASSSGTMAPLTVTNVLQATTANASLHSQASRETTKTVQAVSSQCPNGYYVCDSGSCQPLQWACDGDVDCDDGSDEKYCSGGIKPASRMTVAMVSNTNNPSPITTNPTAVAMVSNTVKPVTIAPSGTSTPVTETKGPTSSGSPECGSGYFYCKLDSLCIPLEWLCDADIDCSDGDDEKQTCHNFNILKDITGVACETEIPTIFGASDLTSKASTQSPPVTQTVKTVATTRKTSTMTPFPVNTVAQSHASGNTNGITQSQPTGNTDGITQSQSSKCPTGFFSCKSTSSCSPNKWLCDGEQDCSDGSDEDNCAATTVPSSVAPNTSSQASKPETEASVLIGR